MSTMGEARSEDLVGEIAPKVLERADQVLKELKDILIPHGEKLQKSKQTSKAHWDDFTLNVKNAMNSTKNLGDRLTTMMNDARPDDD